MEIKRKDKFSYILEEELEAIDEFLYFFKKQSDGNQKFIIHNLFYESRLNQDLSLLDLLNEIQIGYNYFE